MLLTKVQRSFPIQQLTDTRSRRQIAFLSCPPATGAEVLLNEADNLDSNNKEPMMERRRTRKSGALQMMGWRRGGAGWSSCGSRTSGA